MISTTATVVMVSFLFLLLAIAFYFVNIYNGLITIKNNADKSWSNIDVLLKQRHDELPKLVTVCERYMKHEAQTLEKVIRARSMMAGARNMDDRGKAEGMLTGALKSLFAVSENYPELKADKRFAQLQSRITEIESEIADRREFFNESVNIYNICLEKIPDVFVARLLNYQSRELWQINPQDREDVEIAFSC
jgi:LemA protein